MYVSGEKEGSLWDCEEEGGGARRKGEELGGGGGTRRRGEELGGRGRS